MKFTPKEKESDYLQLIAALNSVDGQLRFSLAQVRDLFCSRVVRKSEFFIQEGGFCTEIAFITEGIFRFYATHNGTEKTNDFLFPGSFITSYVSLLQQVPSDLSIQALTNARLLVINRDTLYQLYDTDPRFERIGRILAEQAFVATRTHLLSILHDNAETRYMKLLERAPHFLQLVPLHYIASYLGISPETLSRIRKRISIS